jgi:hypothetical protein
LKKQRIKTIFLIVGGIVLLKLLVLFLVYGTNFNDPLTLTLKRTYPAKVVGSHVVSVYDLETAHKIARRIEPGVSETQVTDRLVRVEKMRNLAAEFGTGLNSDDVSDELTYLKKGHEQEYNKILNEYFDNSEVSFEKFIAYPAAWEAFMQTYYNSDVTANNGNYQKAQDILAKARAGQKFEDLAKQYSDDKVTGQLGGDLGFFAHGEIIPELEDQITISTIGEIYDRIVVTRLGYHIIYPVETAMKDGVKLWHAKHILIQNDGFDSWLNQKTANINTWSLIKTN